MAPASGPPATGGPQVAFLRDRRFVVLLITVGVILILAASVVAFSGAYFTSTSRSPGNEFAAGAVSFDLSQTGPVVNGNEMLPGDIRSGNQVVTNTGHRAELFLEAFVADAQARPPLVEILNIRIQQTVPALSSPAYDGPLADLDRVRTGHPRPRRQPHLHDHRGVAGTR